MFDWRTRQSRYGWRAFSLRRTLPLLAAALLGPLAAAGNATAAPFSCDPSFYQSRVTGTTTTISIVNRNTNPYGFINIGTLSGNFNALAYNPVDNYLYIMRNTGAGEGELFRVESDGTSTSIAPAVVTGGPNTASFDDQGTMYVSNNANTLFQITGIGGALTTRIVPQSADPLPPGGYTGISSFLIGDLSVNRLESNSAVTVFYGLRSEQGGVIYLYRVAVSNPGTASSTARISRIATNAPSGATFGASWLDTDGTMYAMINGATSTQGYYRINRSTGAATNISGATSVSGSDGANCIRATPLVPPTLALYKTTTNGVGGPINFTLTNTGQAAGSVTTTVAGTPAQVDGDINLSGVQTYAVSAFGQPIVITEPAMTGWTLTNATCLDGGVVVGSRGAGAAANSYTIPAANVTSGKAFTCTFTNEGAVDLSVSKTNTPALGPADQAADTVLSGTATTYSLRVVNGGPMSTTGAIVRDTPGVGITCPGTLGTSAVTCIATSSPAGATTCPAAAALTTDNLFGTGITLGALGVSPTPATPNNYLTLSFTCTVQ